MCNLISDTWYLILYIRYLIPDTFYLKHWYPDTWDLILDIFRSGHLAFPPPSNYHFPWYIPQLQCLQQNFSHLFNMGKTLGSIFRHCVTSKKTKTNLDLRLNKNVIKRNSSRRHNCFRTCGILLSVQRNTDNRNYKPCKCS